MAAIGEQLRLPARVLVPSETPATAAGSGRAPSVTPFERAASEGAFAAGVRAAADTRATWLWLLDGVTVPRPDALAELLSASTHFTPDAAPLLLASKVVDDHGGLHPNAIPRHEVFEKERSVEAAGRCLVHLRTACHGSILVSAEAVKRFGPPRSDLPFDVDMLEWSARMLRRWEDAGYLVPASVAVRGREPVRDRRHQWRARSRLLAGNAWSPTEKLWEAFLLGEDLVRRGGA